MVANNVIGVEKYEGTFEKEEMGVTILLNKSLSEINCMDALGMYSYLLSRCAGWKLYPKQLAAHFHCGKEKVYRVLNWLIQEGFITCTYAREKGKFTKPHYRVHLSRNRPVDLKVDLVVDRTKTRATTRFSPCPGKPDTVLSDTENQDTYKTYNVINKDIINKTFVDFEKSTGMDESLKSDYKRNYAEDDFDASKGIDNADYFTKSDYQKNQSEKSTNCSIKEQQMDGYYKNDALFMRFYAAYPNKQKPVIAYKAFRKHKPDEDFVEMLLLDLKMRMDNNWKYRHKSKIPFPATYLNGSEWEGDIYAPESQDEIRKQQQPRYGIGRPSPENINWV